MDKKGHILIGIPTFGDVCPESFASFGQWFYHLGRRMPEYDFTMCVIARKAQWRAKNAILEEARMQQCTHALILDDDMAPSMDIDWLRVLLAHDKDVIGALYFQRGGHYHPVVGKYVIRQESGKGKVYGMDFLTPDELKDELMQVDVLGGGCHLVKVSILDKIMQPYHYEDGFVGQDIYFCKKVQEAGFKVYLDPTVCLGHVQMDREIIDGTTGRAIWERDSKNGNSDNTAVHDDRTTVAALSKHEERAQFYAEIDRGTEHPSSSGLTIGKAKKAGV